MSEPEEPAPAKDKARMYELTRNWEFNLKGTRTGRFNSSTLNHSSPGSPVAVDYAKAELALLAFASRFPEAVEWVKHARSFTETARSFTETARSNVKSSCVNIETDEPRASREELDRKFIEFRRQVKRNMRLFGLVPRKKKPTTNIFVRLCRKWRRWKRPEKPGKQLLGKDELYRWASRIVQKFGETDGLIWTFMGAPVGLMATNDPETGKMLWYCSTFGSCSCKNVQYGVRHGPLAESWVLALAGLREEYPGLFDGTMFPRTRSEVKWWWERRTKLRSTYPLRDFQLDPIWAEWRGPDKGWEISSGAGVLWPLDGSAPATPAEAFIQFRLNKPASFAMERFKGWKGCL